MTNKKEQKEKTTFTPMIQQYLKIKEQNKDVLIFFRLGDFYELFFEDAEIASKELQLFLTSKSAGNNQKIRMCGVPHHAYKSYVQKLLDNGHKVAIVEQLEDPKLAQNKLVQRDVVQIITPGANMDLKTNENNYIASIELDNSICSIAFCDMSTGELIATNVINENSEILSALLDKDVKEVVFSSFVNANLVSFIKQNRANILISECNDVETSLEMEPLFEYLKDPRQIKAITRLINYLRFTQKREISYFKKVISKQSNKVLKIDYQAKNNLELIRSLDNKKVYGTLYWFLNKTKTPMGSRYLKRIIDEPNADIDEINQRLDVVTYFIDNFIDREDLVSFLSEVYDLDRLIARIGYNSTNGHDMLQLKKSLITIPKIKNVLQKCPLKLVQEITNRISNFDFLVEKLEKAIVEEPPITITEGGIFKKGYDSELDELIDINTSLKQWISQLELKERERTNIKTLKVGYTKIFGYYIEISTGALKDVKDEFGYERKQTLTTGERFVTKELKENEEKILHASELRKDREYKLFCELRDEFKTYTHQIQDLSDCLSYLDVLLSFASVSSDNNFVRPIFNDENLVDVKQSRHVVMEQCNKDKKFVPNDFHMDNNTNVLLITGPNMGGKSTYMRQLALNVVMAQIGTYVSAEYYNCPIFDQIFTRIGASDDIIKGQSTFMMEMEEVNHALKQSTSHSLILFDEIGRGTATYDGMALAQAILEYLVTKVHAKTLFSTHYHELTNLVSEIKQIKNIHVGVKEEDGNITFLYKVLDGPMDKSYGINVASLANMPKSLLDRAKIILKTFESTSNKDIDFIKKSMADFEKQQKQEIEASNDKLKATLNKIKKIDPVNLTPLEALNFVFELKKDIGD